MSSKPFLRRKLAVAIGSVSLMLPVMSGVSAVQAQGMAELEEVVVTARKREESLQDTPIAVSAMSGAALKDAGYTNLQNLSESVPGLSLDGGAGTGGAASPYIRGIGQRDTNETLEGGVAIYLDGVYQGRPDGALMDMVDVASVQVLRGPQGTLFGKNSTGGAMMIDTNRPNENFEGDLLLRAGNYNRRDAQLTVNVPLIENTLYSRYSFSSVKRDGYSQQKAPNTDFTIAEWDDEDRLTAQAQFRWLASDAVTVDFNYTWGKQRETGRGAHCIYTLDTTNDLLPAPFLTGAPPQPALPFVIGLLSGFDPAFDFKTRCEVQENYLEEDEFYASNKGLYENDVKGFSTTVNWDIGSWAGLEDVAFKSVTAWRAVDTIQNQEIDGTDLPMIDRTWDDPRQSDQFSQEFQLNFSALEGKLTGVAGLFLYREQTVDGLQNSLVGPFPLADGVIPAAIDAMVMPVDFGGAPVLVGNYQTVWNANRAQKLDTNTETAAAFTQLTYEVNDIVSVTGGLRYNWEKKGLTAAFYEGATKPGMGIYEASDPLPELVAQNLFYDFNDGNGMVPVVSMKQVLDCNVTCDLSVFGLGDPGFTVGQLIPGGTGFFVSNTALQAYDPVAFAADPAALARKYAVLNATKKWIGTRKQSQIDRSLTPMFNIKFTGTDELLDTLNLDTGMAYFTYSRGFKSGGIVAASILRLDDYEPEKVDNYEIGFKIDALGRKLRYNLALYYMDYQDIQVTIAVADPFNPVDVGILQSNAGIASISGVESELTWLPFEGMMIQFNANYTDAKYSTFEYSYVSGLGSMVKFDRGLLGEPMPAVAQWSGYLALQYSFFGDFGALTPRVEASYKTDMTQHFDYASYLADEWVAEEGTTYNARLSWELPDDKTRITAWVKNIENRRTRTSLSPIPEVLGGGSYGLSAPRTYGVDFQYKF